MTATDDARLLPLKAQRDEYVAWWRAWPDCDDEESDRRADHVTALERQMMQMPAATVRGIAARVDLLTEYTSSSPREAPAAVLYSSIDDDGSERLLADYCMDSIAADLERLTGGASCHTQRSRRT
ncbi:MAG TPA: hypothetical protein VGQ93_12165 [Lysobacter sp.]|jgi:hypothetical protein|nr:hypothetical protein [Lysobacter sp.]